MSNDYQEAGMKTSNDSDNGQYDYKSSLRRILCFRTTLISPQDSPFWKFYLLAEEVELLLAQDFMSKAKLP